MPPSTIMVKLEVIYHTVASVWASALTIGKPRYPALNIHQNMYLFMNSQILYNLLNYLRSIHVLAFIPLGELTTWYLKRWWGKLFVMCLITEGQLQSIVFISWRPTPVSQNATLPSTCLQLLYLHRYCMWLCRWLATRWCWWYILMYSMSQTTFSTISHHLHVHAQVHLQSSQLCWDQKL